MQRHSGQRGAALILLIGITAALAILSASLVMLLANQQGATARESTSKTSMYYAEAALNSAIAAVKGTDTWRTTPYSDAAALTAMSTNYNTLPAPRPAVDYVVYDDAATTNISVNYDQNGNGKIWVQVTTTYQGRTTRLRQLVATVTTSVVSKFPKAALFAGGAGSNDNVTLASSGDAYAASFSSWPATNANGIPYTGGAPFPTSIMAMGNITGAGANLGLGNNVQSLGAIAHGTISLAASVTNKSPGANVPTLNTYFSGADQLKLVNQSRGCLDQEVQDQLATAKVDSRPADQRPAAVATTVFGSEAALWVTAGNPYGTYVSGTKTFTANKSLVYNGNLTLSAGYRYSFQSLTVNGNLIVNGNVIGGGTALRVTGTLAINSAAGSNVFGPVYAVGATTIGGSVSNQFGALWVDGSLTLNGSGATSAATLHVGTNGMIINSTIGTNDFGSTYVIGSFTTNAASTSPDQFDALWADGGATLNGSGAVTTGSLHVGGTLSINNSTAITNSFGSTWVAGDLNTTSAARSTNQFGALWVDGGITLNGLTTTDATSVRVGGDFTISGPTSINQFGPVYVVGYVHWGGAASVQTTDYTDATQAPAPMWIGGHDTANPYIGFTRNGGPFNDVYGDVFVVFQVKFTPTSGTSSVLCPLLATTEMITTSGSINFGTMVGTPPRPMTLYQVCDNDGYYTQTVNWGSTGQFYGLMVLMEAGINITNGNPSAPAVVGSVLSIGGDGGVTVGGNAQVAYNQDVIDAVVGTLVTTTTTTQTVPGTWQELSAY